VWLFILNELPYAAASAATGETNISKDVIHMACFRQLLGIEACWAPVTVLTKSPQLHLVRFVLLSVAICKGGGGEGAKNL